MTSSGSTKSDIPFRSIEKYLVSTSRKGITNRALVAARACKCNVITYQGEIFWSYILQQPYRRRHKFLILRFWRMDMLVKSTHSANINLFDICNPVPYLDHCGTDSIEKCFKSLIKRKLTHKIRIPTYRDFPTNSICLTIVAVVCLPVHFGCEPKRWHN